MFDMPSNIEFGQINTLEILTEPNLYQLAHLIFDTDKYISSALFNSENEALSLLSEMIRQNDTMFNVNNFFIAQEHHTIVGMILWHKGSLNWTSDLYEAISHEKNFKVTKYLEKVKKEYFNSYNDIPNDVVSILNVCVDEKKRGQNIGQQMLSSFLDLVGNKYPCELHVLADNKAAIKLYTNNGFEISKQINGFSIDNRELPCLKMIRYNNYERKSRDQNETYKQ